MYKILFIDDDYCRLDGAEGFYRRWLGPIEFTHKTSLWELGDQLPYDLISLDNDLGEGGDVIRILRHRLFENYPQMVQDLSKKHYLVHSCNPVAAEQLVEMFQKDFSLPCYRMPFDLMLKGKVFPWEKPKKY